MALVKAMAFRVSDTNRNVLQCFIKEQIPEDTKFILASSEGYLFFDQELPPIDSLGAFRIPHLTMLSYYDIEYESE